jgi:Leucine-rich repeat (LRR) protein
MFKYKMKHNSVRSKNILLTIIFCVFAIVSKAQLLDSLTLDTLTGFTSIQEALKNPEAVTKLVLRKQHLKSFPKEIILFKNLQYLDISKNSIEELSDSIDLLSNLQYFACSKTGLKRLPKQIGKLSNLKYLNLNQNDLESLPPQIGNLEKLEILDLWSNNFDSYPASLSNLKALNVLDLRNILISDEVQTNLQNMLPKAKVYMSPSCKCKW